MPRVVIAGVPMRSPLATIGGFSSKGIVFLLTVIAGLLQRLFAILAGDALAMKTSTRNRWLSVPPETMR